MIRRGFLSDYFEGVAAKRLSVVETDSARSNQHEFNGTKPLQHLFGDSDRRGIPTRFVWLGAEQEGISFKDSISWYDARRNHPVRTEYRLYYPENEVTELMEAGDTFFIALHRDGSAMVIITPAGSTVQSQLLWLFGIEEQSELDFTVRDIAGDGDAELDFAVRYILDEMGIEVDEPEADKLDALLEQFGAQFPTTRIFSELARSSLPEVSPVDDADAVLMAWLEREEFLFRRLERHIVAERLRTGFTGGGEADVDGFLSFSLSVQNRRKSRAGQSLEHHLQCLFEARDIRFSRGAETENRHKPDFLFPGSAEYHNPAFPPEKLTMLGSKSTLKDRWRQVLTEAERIPHKHLLTLEPAISRNQTDQMMAAMLQLVLPEKLHATYHDSQRQWLFSMSDFIEIVTDRQR